MTTSTCRKGHESAAIDYCDVCGVPMSSPRALEGASGPDRAPGVLARSVGAGRPVGVPGQGLGLSRQAGGDRLDTAREPVPHRPCPVCGTAQTGRFCEEDGYDFLLTPPVAPVAEPVDDPSPVRQVEGWRIVVGADRDYFELIRSLGGTDAAELHFPRFVVERRFVLERRQLLIGRRSRSRGVHPDIDLSGPPEDPGVSHLHALLLPEPDGWAVVDLRSANGSYLNDPSTAAIVPNIPIPLRDGDRVYLGAWTVLTISRNPG